MQSTKITRNYRGGRDFLYDNIIVFCKRSFFEKRQSDAPEVAMWRAVIMQAVLDVMNTSKRTENIVAKKSAISWINLTNKNFINVCNFAKLEPAWVIKKIDFALKNPRTWRRECDIRQNYFDFL